MSQIILIHRLITAIGEGCCIYSITGKSSVNFFVTHKMYIIVTWDQQCFSVAVFLPHPYLNPEKTQRISPVVGLCCSWWLYVYSLLLLLYFSKFLPQNLSYFSFCDGALPITWEQICQRTTFGGLIKLLYSQAFVKTELLHKVCTNTRLAPSWRLYFGKHCALNGSATVQRRCWHS